MSDGMPGDIIEESSCTNSLAAPCYVICVDYAVKPSYSAVTCMKCKKSMEINGAELPPIGWCGCENNEQDFEPKEEWSTFRVGDIVSRIGTDEQEIIGINHAGDLIDVKCIKAPHDNFCQVGDIESNVPWRYTLVRHI